MKHILRITLTAMLALSLLAACTPAQPAPTPTSQAAPAPGGAISMPPLKFAVLLPGNINDGGWVQAAYDGLVYVKQKYPNLVVSYQEAIPEKDFETAFRDYASRGYDLIYGHGFQFGDAALKVAKEFPKTKFVVHSSTVVQAPNVASSVAALEEQGFVVGAVAGLMTKSNVIGIAGGQDIPVIRVPQEYFVKGVTYVNPKAKVLQSYLGTWDDVAKGKETALAYLAQGADVIVVNANVVQLGSIAAAKDKGALAIGMGRDVNAIAPDTVVTSLIWDMGKVMEMFLLQVAEGKFEAKNYVLGFKSGHLQLAPYHGFDQKLSKEVKDKIAQIVADVKEGKIKEALPASK
ncbi:MAG: BMP family protein [Chloroflexi bacterium]|nr:BMP family protein [Chloroflexota bacterium]